MPELVIGCSKSKGKIIQENSFKQKKEKGGSGLALIGPQTTGTWVKIYPWFSANLLSKNWALQYIFALDFAAVHVIAVSKRPELGLRPDFRIFELWFGLPHGSIMSPLF